MNKSIRYLLIFFLISPGIIFSSVSAKNKKYNLSICSIFKNESKYLKEWIEYHLLVGVDHFYLYNNNSSDRFREVLKPYLKKGIVTLIDWPDNWGKLSEEDLVYWVLGTQIPAYENAIIMRGKETKWLTFLDIDEYLVPTNANKITDVLEKYNDSPAVILASDFIDVSKSNQFPKQKLLIEASVLSPPPKQNVQTSRETTIVKPELCSQFSWPPYRTNFKTDKVAAVIKKRDLRINHYLNRNRVQFEKVKEKLYVEERIAAEEEVDKFLESGYLIEEEKSAISRFLPEMRKRLSIE